ncbi:MAG: hypothetical protein ABJB76_00990 [Candidatus Nitrosocosmicus sp.]
MDNTIKNNNKIELCLDEIKITNLNKIVKELYKSNTIESESIEEFLKLTVFIILYEYDKNKQSLNEFYRQNMEIYKKNKDNRSLAN